MPAVQRNDLITSLHIIAGEVWPIGRTSMAVLWCGRIPAVWYLIATRCQAIPPDARRPFARRMDAITPQRGHSSLTEENSGAVRQGPGALVHAELAVRVVGRVWVACGVERGGLGRRQLQPGGAQVGLELVRGAAPRMVELTPVRAARKEDRKSRSSTCSVRVFSMVS
jgi:hypothetical protein